MFNLNDVRSRITRRENSEGQNNEEQNTVVKTIHKHIQLGNDEIIEVSIDAKAIVDENGEESIVNQNNINKIVESVARAILSNTNGDMIMPKSVVISSKEYINYENQGQIDYAAIQKEYEGIDWSILEIENPGYKLDDIIVNDDIKKSIHRILAMCKNKQRIVQEFKLENSLNYGNPIICNFFGDSGTGKNCSVHAIADSLNKKIVSLDYPQLESIEIEDISKTLKAVFDLSKKINAVVVIKNSAKLLKEKLPSLNEIDTRLVTIIRSCLKVEMGKFDSLVFFTSNNKDKIEESLRRLFFINLKFERPNEYEREAIWSFYIKDKIQLSPILDAKDLAQKYKNITAADIKDILFIALSIALEDERDILYEGDFDLAYSHISGR